MDKWKVELNTAEALTVDFMEKADVIANCFAYNEKLWIRISGGVYNVPQDYVALKGALVRIVQKAK